MLDSLVEVDAVRLDLDEADAGQIHPADGDSLSLLEEEVVHDPPGQQYMVAGQPLEELVEGTMRLAPQAGLDLKHQRELQVIALAEDLVGTVHREADLVALLEPPEIAQEGRAERRGDRGHALAEEAVGQREERCAEALELWRCFRISSLHGQRHVHLRTGLQQLSAELLEDMAHSRAWRPALACQQVAADVAAQGHRRRPELEPWLVDPHLWWAEGVVHGKPHMEGDTAS
mmetsp:Transcript_30867/g.91712  ORF Transcript_30867/g.91712 Transcript_30867/m.91712 type:complete len:231 (+) Transcript_30867:450-1142(+)